MKRRLAAPLGLCAALLSGLAGADIRVHDDAGRELVLAQPASRVISLSPHLTELLFHVEAGDRVVGTVSFTDYPPAAASIPLVGDAGQLDLERIVSLKPDLVVSWQSGNPTRQVEQLERLGIPVYLNEPRRLAELASTLERLSMLTGTADVGAARAREMLDRARTLRERYAGRAPVRLFLQIWDNPLMTINDEHLIGELISLCGGINVFGELSTLVPRLSREAVLAQDPEVIITGGSSENNQLWLDEWRRWEGLTAVRRENLFFFPPSLIQRHTPRVLEGAALLCGFLDEARTRRPEDGG